MVRIGHTNTVNNCVPHLNNDIFTAHSEQVDWDLDITKLEGQEIEVKTMEYAFPMHRTMRVSHSYVSIELDSIFSS